jgi:hypothetical protein
MRKKNKHDDYIERLKRFRWLQWQIVRRHEDYIKFCDKQTFNKLEFQNVDQSVDQIDKNEVDTNVNP